MANTYSQIYIQIVFAVKYRQNLIDPSFKNQLEKYITGIVENRNTKMIAIYCMPDHVHLLIGMKPSTLLTDIVRDVKASSSKYINDRNLTQTKFAWQNGFGAFSYSHSHLDRVVKYIRNQSIHHRNKKFHDEYLEYLKQYAVEYKSEYLFETFD